MEDFMSSQNRFTRRQVIVAAGGAGAWTVAASMLGRAQDVTPTTGSPVASPAAMTKINLNTGTDEQFLTVPNVGARFVREFKEYRPYTSIVQFRRELGKYVDDSQVADWEKYVYVPVDPNQADVETLKQLPGVTDDIANQLIALRTFATNADFIAALATLIPADQAQQAAPYLTGA